MLLVILMMIAGGIAGYLLRKRQFRHISTWIMAIIVLLLFVMGVEIGGNQVIISNFASLGLEALAIGIISTLGSISLAWLLWRRIKKHREIKNTEIQEPEAEPQGGLWASLRSCIYIVAAFAFGVGVGYLHLLPSEKFAELSIYVLYVLMFSVGLSIGNDEKTLKSIRQMKSSMALLPLMTIIGTWLGSIVCATFLDRSLVDCLAVGSGMGYYSLSSVMITEAKGADLGAIALLSNVTREILAIVAAPLFARYFGKLAPISAGGCTTADTTLPMITRACGKEFVVLSIYHGVVVDLAVPFLVSFFCSI